MQLPTVLHYLNLKSDFCNMIFLKSSMNYVQPKGLPPPSPHWEILGAHL